jgi:transposase InsO family protein
MRRLRAMGIRDKPTAPASPWQNSVVERLIGSIRRECVDHIIVLGEMHFRLLPNDIDAIARMAYLPRRIAGLRLRKAQR